jgi:outer membrane protein
MEALRAVRVVGAVLAMLVASAAMPAVAAAEMKVGVVDLQRALNESEAGKRAKADFKARVDKLEGQLKGQKDELDRLKDELDRKSVVMKEDERRKLATDFEHKRLDLKRKFEDSQAELQKKDQELTGEILEGLQQVIKQIGDRDSYTMILEMGTSGVVYHANSIDITEQVLAAFNSRSK